MTIAQPTGPVQREGSNHRWIDLAKGFCIILVVMMHTVLGVEKEIGQTGVLHAIVAWTKPFRIPDFFLISGYLAAGVAALDWRSFLDRRILHYAYFYLLWLFIVTLVKAGGAIVSAPGQVLGDLVFGLVEPYSTLWFIYILPLFMLAARMARGPLVYGIGAAAVLLHLWAAAYPPGSPYVMVSLATPSTALNSFALFFVFFFAGYLVHGRVEAWLRLARERPLATLAVLALWAGVHSYSLYLGITAIPGLTVLFGLAGGFALSLLAVALERAGGLAWLAYCGRHSMAIYLAFVIPMAASRLLLVKTGVIKQPDLLMIVVLVIAIIAPLVLERLVRGSALSFLFSRPGWMKLSATKGGA